MVVADVMAVVFSVIGMLLALPGLWLLCAGLWPNQTKAAEADYATALWKSLLTGLIPAAIVFVLVAVLSKLGPLGGIAAIFTVSVFVVYASIGISGLATLVGKRLPSPQDEACPWKCTLRGAIIIEVSCLIPFVGWFILLPMAFILGGGATTRTLFRRKKKEEAVPAAAPANAGVNAT
jgi:hypothetical protein